MAKQKFKFDITIAIAISLVFILLLIAGVGVANNSSNNEDGAIAAKFVDEISDKYKLGSEIEEPKPDEPEPEQEQQETSTPTTQQPKTNSSCPGLESTTNRIELSLASHGIEANHVLPPTPYTTVTYEIMDSSHACDYDSYADTFISEFKKIPTGLSKSTNADMLFGPKVTNSGYDVAAAPLGPVNAVLYDIYGVYGGEQYERHVVLHEFWHQVDYVLYGGFYVFDTDWNDCNPDDFSYGSGGITAYEGGGSAGYSETQGFITEYSKYGMEEDRAEIFAYMIGNKTILDNAISDSNDTRLQCKVDLMEDKIQTYHPSYSY